MASKSRGHAKGPSKSEEAAADPDLIVLGKKLTPVAAPEGTAIEEEEEVEAGSVDLVVVGRKAATASSKRRRGKEPEEKEEEEDEEEEQAQEKPARGKGKAAASKEAAQPPKAASAPGKGRGGKAKALPSAPAGGSGSEGPQEDIVAEPEVPAGKRRRVQPAAPKPPKAPAAAKPPAKARGKKVAAAVIAPCARVAFPPEPSDLFVFGSNPFGALGLGEDETVKFRPAQVPFEEDTQFLQVREGGREGRMDNGISSAPLWDTRPGPRHVLRLLSLTLCAFIRPGQLRWNAYCRPVFRGRGVDMGCE